MVENLVTFATDESCDTNLKKKKNELRNLIFNTNN